MDGSMLRCLRRYRHQADGGAADHAAKGEDLPELQPRSLDRKVKARIQRLSGHPLGRVEENIHPC